MSETGAAACSLLPGAIPSLCNRASGPCRDFLCSVCLNKVFYPAAPSPPRSRSPARSSMGQSNCHEPSPTQLWQDLLLRQRGGPPSSCSPSAAEDSPGPPPPDDCLEYRIGLERQANSFLEEIIDHFLGRDRDLDPTFWTSPPSRSRRPRPSSTTSLLLAPRRITRAPRETPPAPTTPKATTTTRRRGSTT